MVTMPLSQELRGLLRGAFDDQRFHLVIEVQRSDGSIEVIDVSAMLARWRGKRIKLIIEEVST